MAVLLLQISFARCLAAEGMRRVNAASRAKTFLHDTNLRSGEQLAIRRIAGKACLYSTLAFAGGNLESLSWLDAGMVFGVVDGWVVWERCNEQLRRTFW
jgi:hypothetical protein